MKKSKAEEPLHTIRYLCPEHHVTYAKSDRRAGRPERTAIVCKAAIANGIPCNRFALFHQTLD